jgi:hypothetical protein
MSEQEEDKPPPPPEVQVAEVPPSAASNEQMPYESSPVDGDAIGEEEAVTKEAGIEETGGVTDETEELPSSGNGVPASFDEPEKAVAEKEVAVEQPAETVGMEEQQVAVDAAVEDAAAIESESLQEEKRVDEPPRVASEASIPLNGPNNEEPTDAEDEAFEQSSVTKSVKAEELLVNGASVVEDKSLSVEAGVETKTPGTKQEAEEPSGVKEPAPLLDIPLAPEQEPVQQPVAPAPMVLDKPPASEQEPVELPTRPLSSQVPNNEKSAATQDKTFAQSYVPKSVTAEESLVNGASVVEDEALSVDAGVEKTTAGTNEELEDPSGVKESAPLLDIPLAPEQEPVQQPVAPAPMVLDKPPASEQEPAELPARPLSSQVPNNEKSAVTQDKTFEQSYVPESVTAEESLVNGASIVEDEALYVEVGAEKTTPRTNEEVEEPSGVDEPDPLLDKPPDPEQENVRPVARTVMVDLNSVSKGKFEVIKSSRDLELEALRHRGLAKRKSKKFVKLEKKSTKDKATYEAGKRDLEKRKANTSEFQVSGYADISPHDTLRLSQTKLKNENRKKERETMLQNQCHSAHSLSSGREKGTSVQSNDKDRQKNLVRG